MKLALFVGMFLQMLLWIGPVREVHAAQVRPWTVLIYMNAKNSLDSFSEKNLNFMEQVGSTDRMNIVVEWGSFMKDRTLRLLISKDQDRSKVSSPVLEDIGNVDMGDWRTLRDFLIWGAEKFPAEHYAVVVWDHGTGWHSIQGFKPSDISRDDETEHSISTQELGQALREAAVRVGHVWDLYGSDACLMGMLEIATELADSVRYFVGSEAVEPGTGWPYEEILKAWNEVATPTPEVVAKTVVEQYARYYERSAETTFSALDLSKLPDVLHALRDWVKVAGGGPPEDARARADALRQALAFSNPDYVDLESLMGLWKVDALSSSLSQMILSNEAKGDYAAAGGVSIWYPGRMGLYEQYWPVYRELRFERETGWGEFVGHELSSSPSTFIGRP